MIRTRVHRANLDPSFARKAAPAEAAIVGTAYGVTADVIYTLARGWLVECADMPGATVLDDVETAHHVEYDHSKGWSGFLADPYILEDDLIPAKVRADVLAAAREWIWDARGEGIDAGQQVKDLTTSQILRTVDRTYGGGWVQFLEDGNPPE